MKRISNNYKQGGNTMKRISWIVALVIISGVASVHATDYFVDASRPDDSGDGLSWATAKHTIQAAIDTADGYDTIWVTNGVYSDGGTVAGTETLTNRVTFYGKYSIKLIAVSSNPADTVIVGAPDTGTGGNGPGAIRCIRQGSGHNGIIVSGFTISNGYTDVSGQRSGGGISGWATTAITVTNCIITDCNAYYRGGGASSITIYNSTIKNCVSETAEGGGVYKSDVYNCTISKNTCGNNKQGAGAFQGDFWNCVFSNNATYNNGASGAGGAGARLTAYDCLFVENKAKDGGALEHSGTFIRCTFKNNTAERNGGVAATYDGGSYKFVNCLFENNIAGTSSSYKGNGSVLKFRETGADTAVFLNCTIVSNQADGVASALYGSRTPTNIFTTNCIIYANTDFDDGSTNNYNEKVLMSYCLTTPLPSTGSNNISDAPIFVGNGDYHLDWGSPGIDAGTVITDITNDLALASRPIDGNNSGTAEYDMGCYETDVVPPAQGTLFIIN